jgi:arginine repressor
LDEALDSFLVENQDEFKTIILAGQDKETTDEVAKHMREMFVDYLTEDHGQDESIQTKLDESLKALKEIAHRTHRMAYADDLDAVEKKTRRAVACLFSTVRDNKEKLNLPTQEGAQQTVAGLLESSNDSTPR